MNRFYRNVTKLLFPVFVLAFFFGVIANPLSSVDADQGCSNGDGWIKVDSGDWYPIEGATEYCFKYGSPDSQGCVGGISDTYPPEWDEKWCGLSHWSYYTRCTPPPCQETYTCSECETLSDDQCSDQQASYCQKNYDCDWLGEGKEWTCNCQEPTPILTGTVTPTPTDTPSVGGPGDPGPPVCNDSVPDTPTILSVVGHTDSVTVTWTKVGNANDYSIVYGPTSGDYPYSVFSAGDIDNYTINGISSGCFRVKAINGCMPGELSPEVCTGSAGGQVLGASTLGATGAFADNIFNLMIASGMLLTAFGVAKSFKTKLITLQ